MRPGASTEPSAFELDVYFAEGCSGNAALAAHVARCAHCAAYLARLAAPAAAPAFGARLERRERARPATLGRSAVLRATLAAAAGALASVMLWQAVGEPGRRDYVASKGVPAVQAVISSAGGARVWDGKAPLRAGDAIALRASCEPYSQLSVAVARGAAKGAGGFVRVFDGACPKRGDALPFTLVADDEPGEERIDVVFSHGRLDDVALADALRRLERSDTAWVHRIVLKKAKVTP